MARPPLRLPMMFVSPTGAQIRFVSCRETLASLSIAVTHLNRWCRRLVGAALVIVAVSVYGHGPGLRVAESEIEMQARMLVENRGHDRDGRMLPLFVHGEHGWLAPGPVYVTAVLKLIPFGAPNARWSAALFGAVSVLLLYAFVIRCGHRAAVGFTAAVLLLFTPSHVIFSRTASADGVWHVPFILGWAMGLTSLRDSPSSRTRWMLAAGTASLALSTYAQPSRALMMPMFAMVTVAVFLCAHGWRIVDIVPAAVAFCGGLLPLLFWYFRFPETFGDTLGQWVGQAADVRSAY